MEPYILNIITLFEFVNTAACINQLLLTGKEGMALVAYIHFENVGLFGCSRSKRCAASAYNRDLVIIGMYSGLHNSPLAHFLKYSSIIYKLFR